MKEKPYKKYIINYFYDNTSIVVFDFLYNFYSIFYINTFMLENNKEYER